MNYDNTNSGVAFKNDYKTEDKHPYYKGKGNFNGQDFEFGIWIKENDKGKFLTFRFSEPYQKPDDGQVELGNAVAKAVDTGTPVTLDELNNEEPINLDDIPF